jgi:hypothetical protein
MNIAAGKSFPTPLGRAWTNVFEPAFETLPDPVDRADYSTNAHARCDRRRRQVAPNRRHAFPQHRFAAKALYFALAHIRIGSGLSPDRSSSERN